MDINRFDVLVIEIYILNTESLTKTTQLLFIIVQYIILPNTTQGENILFPYTICKFHSTKSFRNNNYFFDLRQNLTYKV